jgi:hypothetical protein
MGLKNKSLIGQIQFPTNRLDIFLQVCRTIFDEFFTLA